MYRVKVLIGCIGWMITLMGSLQAQDLYYIFFTDKEQTDFDPSTWFDPEAQERRRINGLPAYDSTDLPLRQEYVARISQAVDSVRYQLRWLNALTVRATPAQIREVAQLPFVREIEPFDAEMTIASVPDLTARTNGKFDTLLSMQRIRMQLDTLEAHGLTGKGVRVAIFDTGFKEAETHPALAHVFANGQVLATRDFYSGGEQVYHHSRHGMQVMSCVAGRYHDRQLGCAQDAQFLLARIEHESKEKAIEEDHWIAAAEWADRNGAQIINSSVTYTFKRYTYRDMNGRIAPVSRAAVLAAKKGILVVCSMGNEGETDWQYMGAPADAPEVLSVGGSMPMVPMHIPFASIGPNAEKRRKPDVSAPAYVLAALKNEDYDVSVGTSFSSPLIAGLAACMLQREPEITEQALFEQICQLGHYYPYYDYYLGYGIPNAARIFHPNLPNPAPTFEVVHQGDSIILSFDPAFMAADSAAHPDGRVLYYHFETPNRYLNTAHFTLLPNLTRYYFFRRRPGVTGIVRIWFEGYLYEEENDIPR
jgi:serine protease AprX